MGGPYARRHDVLSEDPTATIKQCQYRRRVGRIPYILRTSVTPVPGYPSSSHMTAMKSIPAGCVKLSNKYGDVAVDGSVMFWMNPCGE